MPVQGYFTFVLHSHIPYVRAAGRWPFGEETLHEAIAETYVPLLNALYDLVDAGMQPRLTIGITPILLEQIADADVAAHFELYVQEKMALAEADMARFAQEGNKRFLDLARFYHGWYSNVLQSFQERYDGDLVGAFRRLQDGGYLDILTSAATHGYLPLMERAPPSTASSKWGGTPRRGVLAERRAACGCQSAAIARPTTPAPASPTSSPV